MNETLEAQSGLPDMRAVALEDIAEREFLRLAQNAQAALNALGDFWTRLYGPNEALLDAHAELLAMDAEFFSQVESGEEQ